MSVDWHTHPDPLPGDFDPSLGAIDDRLAADAAERAIPEGLVDRVFDASVQLLPSRRPEPVLATLQFNRPMWGRLAMAASLVVAFVLGARVLRSPAPEQPVVGPVVVSNVQLSREAELVLIGTLGLQATGMQDLVTTRDATLDDFMTEIAMLVAELEM